MGDGRWDAPDLRSAISHLPGQGVGYGYERGGAQPGGGADPGGPAEIESTFLAAEWIVDFLPGLLQRCPGATQPVGGVLGASGGHSIAVLVVGLE